MEAWWAAAQPGKDGSIRLLDLACGSGEATQAIEAWWQCKCGGSAIGSTAASQQPSSQGCKVGRGAGCQGGDDPQGQGGAGEREAGGIGMQGDAERRPARATASSAAATAAGDGAAAALAGLVTTTTTTAAAASAQAAREAAAGVSTAQGVTQQRLPQLIMDACDPYTYEAFEKWVGRPAERWTFQDIADGCLLDRSYDLAISRCASVGHLSEGVTGRVLSRVAQDHGSCGRCGRLVLSGGGSLGGVWQVAGGTAQGHEAPCGTLASCFVEPVGSLLHTSLYSKDRNL